MFGATRSRAILCRLTESQNCVVAPVLRRLGWPVFRSDDICAVRELLAQFPGSVVILGADGSDESIWLACAKLTQPTSLGDVLLIGSPTPHNRRLARFVGAQALIADPVEVSEWIQPM